VLSGGKAQVQDEKGTRKIDIVTGAFADAPPTPWHEFTNIGETMVQVLLVEKKYQCSISSKSVGVPKMNNAISIRAN
jgi:hypothetical protein